MSDDTLCCTCGSPIRVVGDVTKSYEPIHAHDRSYIKALSEVARLKEALEHYAQGAPVIGFDRGEMARAALQAEKESE